MNVPVTIRDYEFKSQKSKIKATESKYEFSAKPWLQHDGPGGWCFVSLPVKMSEQIRKISKWDEEGWGRLKARAKIGKTEWATAIWFDSRRQTYLLPLKAEIRRKENILLDESRRVILWI